MSIIAIRTAASVCRLWFTGSFPPLQARMKSVMAQEMEVVVKEEKYVLDLRIILSIVELMSDVFGQFSLCI